MRGRVAFRDALLAGLVAGPLACLANAQSALGSGRGLDKNLQRAGPPGGAAGPGRASAADSNRLNNAIVTGDVSGGRQFRGSLGYSAETDFRGRTGSDDIFNFQRNSFSSGLAAQGVRGIEGLTNTLTPGSAAGGVVQLRRATSGATASDISSDPAQAMRFGVNPASLAPTGSLRSTSRYLTDRASEPLVFQPLASSADQTRLGVSSLLGIYSMAPRTGATAPQSAAAAGADTFPGLPTIPGVSPGTTPAANVSSSTMSSQRPGETDSTKVSSEAEPSPQSTRVEPQSTYQRLVEQLEKGRMGDARAPSALEAKGEQDDEEGKPKSTWTRPPEEAANPPAPGTNPPTQGQTAPGLTPPAPGSTGDPNAPGAPGEPEDPSKASGKAQTFEEKLQALRQQLVRDVEGAARGQRKAPNTASLELDKEKAKEAKDEAAMREVGAAVRRDARDLFGEQRPMITRFVDPEKDPGAFDRHLLRAQELLAEGKWFDAEELFTKAMVVRTDDPLPAVGRTHAQLGAGMFLSAATNLRAILRDRPELATVKYDAALLPREARLAVVLDSLRDAATRNNAHGRDAGLLLAYLGFQSGNAGDIQAGLDAIERVEDHLEMARDPLSAMLRELWTP